MAFTSQAPMPMILLTLSPADFTQMLLSLTLQVARVHQWAGEKVLVLSALKSTVTLFTSWNGEVHDHPEVHLNNSPLPLERNPRILGVTFDPPLNFSSSNIENLRTRAGPRIIIMKALSSST